MRMVWLMSIDLVRVCVVLGLILRCLLLCFLIGSSVLMFSLWFGLFLVW